ncbi:hypothetical protein KJ866_00530 [Patescibacteria group bacterium]|nr:hypothetical protein [Patescibacteria group bacterium]MBU2264778.1 hypothetical protein [Patescibacteria group bacterium]
MKANKAARKGFTLQEFVTSCSTCMGKEGLLNTLSASKTPKKPQAKKD